MDCCSLAGRTLKHAKVVGPLSEYVLVRLEPMDWDEDKEFAQRFGVENFPSLLLLDWTGEMKLGVIGDVSPEEVAKGLTNALGK